MAVLVHGCCFKAQYATLRDLGALAAASTAEGESLCRDSVITSLLDGRLPPP